MKPNFSRAYSAANEILVRSNIIASFPFSPVELVKEQALCVCRSYSLARRYGINMEDFGSESAIIMSMGGKTIIFYDDSKPNAHIYFSIIHELGHLINKHDYRLKDEEVYGRYEVETNFFTAQLLMPEQLIRELQHRGVHISSGFLQSEFGVSGLAADKRILTLAKTSSEWRSRAEREFDDIILLKYASFLNRICPITNGFDFDEEYEKQRERERWL